jgi:DNA polymerase-4
LKGRTITLKVKYHDFKIITRSLSLAHLVDDFETIYTTAKKLLDGTDLEEKRIRLLGISISNFRMETSNQTLDQLTLEL